MVLFVTDTAVVREAEIKIPVSPWAFAALVDGVEALILFAVLVLPIVLLLTVSVPVDSSRIPNTVQDPTAVLLVVIDPIRLLLILITPLPVVAIAFPPPV